jgi:protein arginine kinase activator
MLCDICKKSEATVHLTQIIEGKMIKVEMCEACSKVKGMQDAIGFSLGDLVGSLAGVEEMKTEGPGIKCPTCGMTQADFKKIGRLGCAGCWEMFEAGMGPLLKAMHKSDRHVGKVPSKAAHTLVISEQIKELVEELHKAINAEQYERAAKLRDEIHGLEGRLKDGKTPV